MFININLVYFCSYNKYKCIEHVFILNWRAVNKIGSSIINDNREMLFSYSND